MTERGRLGSRLETPSGVRDEVAQGARRVLARVAAGVISLERVAQAAGWGDPVALAAGVDPERGGSSFHERLYRSLLLLQPSERAALAASCAQRALDVCAIEAGDDAAAARAVQLGRAVALGTAAPAAALEAAQAADRVARSLREPAAAAAAEAAAQAARAAVHALSGARSRSSAAAADAIELSASAAWDTDGEIAWQLRLLCGALLDPSEAPASLAG